jgi:hypothetical protein
VPATSAHPVGALYLCWKTNALYLASFVIDVVEPDYYLGKEVPGIDRAVWTIRVNGGEAITARLGSGMPPTASEPTLRMRSLGGTYHDIRCITVIELPAERIGQESLQPGDKVSLDATFTTHGRAYRIDWKGEFVLSE